MDTNLPKKRKCIKEKDEEKIAKAKKSIFIPIEKKKYIEIQNDYEAYRKMLDEYIKRCSEIFPEDIINGYYLHDSRGSKKQERRIKLKKTKSVFKFFNALYDR